VILVLVIVAIVAAVVIPHVIHTSSLQAVSAARMLTTDLQYAEGAAVASQVPVTILFDTNAEKYTLRNAGGTLIHPVTKDLYVVDFASQRGFKDVNIVSANFGGAAQVTFDAMGAPNKAGTVVLQAGSHVYTVTVTAITGKVTVQGS
jgi:Tfp pilus assembly protein FimT